MAMLRGILKGTSPLLMHNPASMQRPGDNLAKLGQKNIPSPSEEAERSSYKFPNGDLCVPAVAVRNSMLTSCSGLTLAMEGQARRKAATPIISGAVIPSDQYFALVTSDGEPITDYEIDTQRAVVQRQGIMRSRARIDPPWQIIYSFLLNDGILDINTIVSTVTLAFTMSGTSVGLLDYRPQKKGWYGMYEVGEIDIVET